MTISQRELRNAVRAALRQGQIGRVLALAARPQRDKVQRWVRGSVQRAYSALGAAGSAPTKNGSAARRTIPYPVPESADAVEAVMARAAADYTVTLPPEGTPATYRAAGGRRLPYPSAEGWSADLEDIHAWHRMYWLLERCDDETFARLRDWLATPPDETASRSYTTSERIRITAEVLGTYGPRIPPGERRGLVNRLRADAAWLYDHLETRLGVHNHLLNDARGLCAAGHLLEEESWLARARAVWDEYWPALILDDGVFEEQSTHYHVLLTRTLLEYVRDARQVQRPLPAGFLRKAEAMCRVTNALVRPDGTIPLFGDVSPDMPTRWLRGLPSACARAGLLHEPPRDSAEGYAGGASALFRAERPPTGNANGAGWQTTFFPCGGILVVENRSLGLELAATSEARPHEEKHGDAGRGTFEVWWRGQRVVVDGGMPTYQSGDLRDRFRGAEGQNVITLDGLPPTMPQEDRRRLPGWYTRLERGGTWQIGDGAAALTWQGFERLRPGLTWVRTWRWSDTGLTVEDRITGDGGTLHAEAWIHLGETGWTSPARGQFVRPGCALRVESAAEVTMTLEDRPHSPDYGVINKGQGIRLSGRVRLPAAWTWVFEFER